MKFIVFSDAQFYHNPQRSVILPDGSYSWLNEQFKVVNQIFDFAKENGVSTIIHNGDLFEQKNLINVATLNLVWEFFRDKKDFELIFNTGNHDFFSDKRESSLKPFTDFAKIIEEPWELWNKEQGEIVLRFLPYNMIDGFLEPPKTNGRKFLFIHENVSGLKIGVKDFVIGSQYKPHIFNGWDCVFCGHIHKPQQLNNILVVGSPMQHDFGEAGDEKRFLYFDGEEIHSIKTDCPQFHILDEIPKEINDRDYYRINISSDQLDDVIFGKPNIIPCVVSTPRESEVRLSRTKLIEEELEEYVDLLNSELDHEKLLKVGKEFVG